MYVDDSIVAENWPSKFNQFMQFLEGKIDVTDEGCLAWYLSVRYQYNLDKTSLMAFQQGYIEKVARTFGLDENAEKGPATPMSETFSVEGPLARSCRGCIDT